MSICVRQRVLIKICRELLKIARKIVDSTSLISPKHIFTATKEETKNQVSSVHKIFALVRLHIAIRCTPPKKTTYRSTMYQVSVMHAHSGFHSQRNFKRCLMQRKTTSNRFHFQVLSSPLNC